MSSPPRSPPSGPEVDDVVRVQHDVDVVLDDDDGVAAIGEALQHGEQVAHVLEERPVVGSSRM